PPPGTRSSPASCRPPRPASTSAWPRWTTTSSSPALPCSSSAPSWASPDRPTRLTRRKPPDPPTDLPAGAIWYRPTLAPIWKETEPVKRARNVVAAATTVTLALALSACASGDTPADDSGETAAEEAPAGDIRVWLVGSDTPEEAREHLKTTFEAENEGSTLTIEEQSWTGL